MAYIYIKKTTFDQIKQFPLFFFNRKGIESWDNSGPHTDYYWIPEPAYAYRERPNRISETDLPSDTRNILFTYGQPSEETQNNNELYIKVNLEQFNPNNPEHVQAVFNIYIIKAYDASNKFAFRELLWMLNSYQINTTVIKQVLNNLDNQLILPFILNGLKAISICLSTPKQETIQQLLSSEGVSFNVYMPQILDEALKIAYPTIDFSNSNLNIFSLISIVLKSESFRGVAFNEHIETDPKNIFLQIRKWLQDPEFAFRDFETLSTYFRFFSPSTQIKLIKRYFHSVRTGKASFNSSLLEVFKNNPFENWRAYHHCVFEPCRPVNISVELLCDNILTFLNSGHQELQTINGTLDMAYTHCDTNSPQVDFGLKTMIPICRGGVIPNITKFKGFICYKIVYVLNENSFNQDNLSFLFRQLLSNYGRQKWEYICLASETQEGTCKNRINNTFNLTNCNNCKLLGSKFLNIFNITLSNNDFQKKEILNLFTDVDINFNVNTEVNPIVDLLPTHQIKQRVNLWCERNLHSQIDQILTPISGDQIKLPAGWTIPECNSEFDFIAKYFLSPKWIIIEPRKNAYLGCGVLNETIEATSFNTSIAGSQSYDAPRIQQLENSFIRAQISSSLIEILNIHPNTQGQFFAIYNDDLFSKIKSLFYTPGESDNSDTFDDNNAPFLKVNKSKYDKYCAPKFENNENKAIKLPFMWCRGKECFKNSLDNQTLEKCNNWEKYSLLHILEILGYPQIIKTPGGNEASELIRRFIGMVNQASALFSRVICRECNHILFPIGTSNFNRYNNFECRVPTCSERWKKVYLSNCHHCKTGLIDSRDTKQCPNGWHICPKCLSCCDNDVYDRMAQRYSKAGRPVPAFIAQKIGHGHNSNNEYFCPNCGGPIEDIPNPNSQVNKICQTCGTPYYI